LKKANCKPHAPPHRQRSGTISGGQHIKKEYDFSKGERGKFYRPDLELHLPIYLDPDTMETLLKFSEEKGVAVEAIVKDWIDKDISIVKTVISK
jgi:hypothetical protein